MQDEKIKSNVNHKEQLNHQKNKNEPETSPILPTGFYLVNQQQQSINGKLNGKTSILQNSFNEKKSLKQLNGMITTPGYNVTQTNSTMPNRSRKCDSVFSVRSQRSRAAYSEMAYSDKRHHYKNHKNCSHKRRHRKQSNCSHRHKDCLDYEDDCNLSFDEFEERSIKHHHHSRKNRSRSYHALYDSEADHKYLNEQDTVENCCSRNRNSRNHRRHRSCCLNELRYDDSGQEEESYLENEQDDNASLCSSIHSLNKSYCKRRHKRKESNSKLSLKIDQENNANDEKVSELKSIIKRSFKNLKLIDQLDCEELANIDNEENQSDTSELSYCSHHSRRSHRHSRGCHRSKSKCKHSRSRCKHHAESYSDLLGHDSHHHQRSLSRRRRARNLSCESLTDDDAVQINEKQKNKANDENNKEKFYRANANVNKKALINVNHSDQYAQFQPQQEQHQRELNNHSHKIQNSSNQYLLPPQQFSNQYAYNCTNQNVQGSRAMIVPKYNTVNYRSTINEQHQQQHQPIPNSNFIHPQTSYFPNYTTMANNFIKPIQYNQSNNQIGLPNVYQMTNTQFKTNANSINQNGIYLMGNNLQSTMPVNSSINSHLKNDQMIDKSCKQQVYQNLQGYLKELPRY